MKIVILPYIDIDVTDGMCDLVHQYPDGEIVLPITGLHVSTSSVVRSAEVHGVKTVLLMQSAEDMPPLPVPGMENPWLSTSAETSVAHPHDEAIRRAGHGDVVAFIFSPQTADQVDRDKAYLEGFGVTLWDISDGLHPLGSIDDYSQEEAQDWLDDAIEYFAEALTAYVVAKVKAVVDEAAGGIGDATVGDGTVEHLGDGGPLKP